jgi:hypothetical protein
MICVKCNIQSPDGKAYCADCGAPLDPADERVRNVVQEALRDAFRDQRYLPIEIADKAVERLWFYGRIVAIPIALVLVVLGAWGINTYKDAVRTIRTVGDQAVTNLQEHASNESEKVSQTTRVVLDRLGQAESKNLPGQVSRLIEQASKAAKEVQVAETRVVQQASKAGKELQNAEALAAQYGEEVKRLRTSIVASPPPSPTVIGTLGSAVAPLPTGLGIADVTSLAGCGKTWNRLAA